MVEGSRKDNTFQASAVSSMPRRQDSLGQTLAPPRASSLRQGFQLPNSSQNAINARSQFSDKPKFQKNQERKSSLVATTTNQTETPVKELALTQGTQGQQPISSDNFSVNGSQQHYDQILLRIHNDRQKLNMLRPQPTHKDPEHRQENNSNQKSKSITKSKQELDGFIYSDQKETTGLKSHALDEEEMSLQTPSRPKPGSNSSEIRKNSQFSKNGMSIIQSIPQKSETKINTIEKQPSESKSATFSEFAKIPVLNPVQPNQTQQEFGPSKPSFALNDQFNKDYPYVARIVQNVSEQSSNGQYAAVENAQQQNNQNDHLVSVAVNPERNKKKNVLVNTSHCRAEIDTVQYVINKFGYREASDQQEGNLIWFGIALRDGDIDQLKSRICMINRYPLMDHFAKKNIFCVIVSRLQRFFPQEYKFMPDSFLLPDEIQDFEIHMRHFPNQTFICKPSRGRGGEGITLLRKFSDLPKNAFTMEYLVQRYIDNPLLISGKKFDIRLYVVIKGVEKIEAYVCEEGLARFCTSNYKRPDGLNMKNLYMHLTNYSLNKQSEKFKTAGTDFADVNSTASKQLLSSVYKKLQAKGRDVRLLKKNIDDVVAKTVIALEPYLKNAYHCFISADHENPRCFQILGLDILMDENWNCWLMEVNANPSLNVYNDKELPNGDIEQTLSEIDKYVKTTLIADTIALVTTAPLYQTKKPEEGTRIYQSPAIQEQGQLRLVLPSQNNGTQFEQLYMYSKAEKIFEYLAGQKSYDFITASQFQRLSKFQNMTNQQLQRPHYDIIYKNVIRRSENSQMDLNCFFEALEDIAQRLFQNKKNTYDNLTDIITNVISQM